MGAPVVPIGIPPSERARLCAVAASDVCQHAATYLHSIAQCKAVDAAATPYIRAVYVHRAGRVVADRVAVASAIECGSYLRDALQNVAVGTHARTASCWLTVTLDDTCVLQHALFGITADSKEPHNLMTPVVLHAVGAAHQPGVLQRSLKSGRSTPSGNVYTPHDTALLAKDCALPSSEFPAAMEQRQRPAFSAQRPIAKEGSVPQSTGTPRESGVSTPRLNANEKPQQYQVESSLDEASSRPSSPAAPSIEAARYPGDQESATSTPTHPLSYARLNPTSTAPRSAGARGLHSNNSQPSGSDRAAANQADTSRPLPNMPSNQPARRRGSVSSGASSVGASDHVPIKSTAQGLLVHGSLPADLVMPRDGAQWGDWAVRMSYAPRREELWKIADAVMTHNYSQMIDDAPAGSWSQDESCHRHNVC